MFPCGRRVCCGCFTLFPVDLESTRFSDGSRQTSLAAVKSVNTHTQTHSVVFLPAGFSGLNLL